MDENDISKEEWEKERETHKKNCLIYKFICEMKNDKKKRKRKIIVIGHRNEQRCYTMDISRTQCLEYNPEKKKKIGGNSNGNNTSESRSRSPV